jgi:hypothetical protein
MQGLPDRGTFSFMGVSRQNVELTPGPGQFSVFGPRPNVLYSVYTRSPGARRSVRNA